MAINKISDATRSLIREKSVLSLPDRPSEKGYSAQQLKEYFTNLVLGDQGALTEIDRIVDEINELVGDISDTTIKNYVLDSIVSKLIEQSPYIGLSIVNNKLKYTKFGSPNITGELDYIPEDSVFFNGEYLTNKSKENILPKTSIDKLIDTIDDKTVREYILYLNSRINELLGKHNSEISTINSNIESILGGDAPDALNSIKELAEALKNNPSQVDNILLQLSNLNSGKVDKVDGKQLSTNDYDNVSKSFVDSLKSKNLVEVENLKTDLKQFNDDSDHRLVTDVEKATWNSKANSIHSHEINDVNGLQNALNSKSASNHTHTADDIGAEKIGVAAGLIDSHNKSTTAHEDIRKILSELTNKIDGINSAVSFENEQELSNWLSGSFARSDGLTPNDLFIGQHIYIKDQDENDYWVSTKPVNSISDLTPLPTDKINLEDYAEIDDLKRVAFTGSCKDLIDFPTIPSSLAEMTEDENHKVITQEKLTLIDTNASNILTKLDKNLGSNEANKMLITDSNGNIITAIAGSMSALIDNLESTSTTAAPTANQVRILNNNKLDKQQGTENANKYLYVNSLGLIDLAAIKTKLSEFENDNSYQTLTEVEKMISAIPTPDVSGQIENHNNDEEAHEDIRNSIPVVTNDLTNELKKNYDAAYIHSTSAHAPTTMATSTVNGLMSSTDKSNVDANTSARHTHSNKTALDAVTIDWMNSLASQTFVTEKINAMPTPDVSGQISTHNADSSAHQDIRNLIDAKISSLINGAPTTLDTLKEIADAMSANKTVVDALETAIGNKEDKANLKALAYKDSLSKSDVGLGNVDNTSDANKPISTATQTALNTTNTNIAKKLDKVTYEYNRELAIGSTGKVLVGKFPMYDSNITINVSSTTNTTYNGTLVIATQNINDSHGGSYVANVYGDPTGTLSSAFVVKYPTNSRVFEVYCDFTSWSKNLIHIKAVALSSAPSNIVELVTTIPTDSLVTVNNVLKNTFLTGITSAQVTSALGYTPYNSTNPNGYVTSSGSVASATKATQDGNGNNIVNTYATKSELGNKANSNEVVKLTGRQEISGIKNFTGGTIGLSSTSLGNTSSWRMEVNGGDSPYFNIASPYLEEGEFGVDNPSFKIYKNGTVTINDEELVKISDIPKLVTLTQAEYDALSTKDANTYYFIKEE